MTHVATMGTFSCATIALGKFKAPNKELNEKWKADPNSFDESEGEGYTVQQFYNKILYPTSQPLGRSKEYPFGALMEAIDNGPLNSKFIIATLNAAQQEADPYWPNELKAAGFVLVDKTKNDIGGMNYIYVRNNNRPEGVTLGGEFK